MLTTVRACLDMLPAGSRARWALLVPIAIATGVLEAGAAAAVLGLIRILSDPDSIATIPVAAAIARWLPPLSGSALILSFTSIVVTYHVLKNVLLVGAQYVRQRIVAESRAALSMTMLRGYLAAPYSLHVMRNSSDLRRNIDALPNAVCDVLGSITTLLSEVLVAAGLALVLFVAAPAVSMAAGLVVALLVLGTLRWTKTRAFELGKLSHRVSVEVDRVLQQAIGGVKELKVLGREASFDDRYAVQQRRALDISVMGTTLHAIPALVIESCFVVGALFVIALVTINNAAGPSGLPLLAVFTYSGFRLIPAINRMTWRINAIRGHATVVQTLYSDFRLVAPLARAPRRAAPASRRDWRVLSLDGVAFRYEGADADVLHDVAIEVRRGETLGIVGTTGAGKTTLVDVLLGLLAPAAGNRLVDGQPAPAMAGPRCAYAPQNVFIADDTLARNVAFGVAEQEIDRARVQRAIEWAQLGALVATWPQGVDTMVGERGARLSGGERQRVGIARAMYHDPDLLVLDEATSALDSVTEAAVLSAIAAAHVTVVIVAHRLSTIRHCDRIAVVVEGRVAATGSFDELLRTSGEFKRLVEAGDAIRAAAVP